MKAVRYYGKHDLRTEEAPEPGELRHGQVLVQPTYCGICGTDLHEFEVGADFYPGQAKRIQRRCSAPDTWP